LERRLNGLAVAPPGSDLMGAALEDFCSAVALDLVTLAQLHDRELDSPTVMALQQERFPRSLAFRLHGDRGRDVLDTLSSVVARLSDDATEQDDLAADFAAIYLTYGLRASPCESVWLDEDGLAMQEPMFEVRRDYARLGLQAPDWRVRPDDHLVFQLQFVAALIEEADEAAVAEAARFLDGHTLRWLPDFAGRVAQHAATPFYAALAVLTDTYLDELRDTMARMLGERRPTAEEIEQRNRRVGEGAGPEASAYVPGSAPSW
jgi:TorA maturation chaperone TorD